MSLTNTVEKASLAVMLGSVAASPFVFYNVIPLLWKAGMLLDEDRTQQDMVESIGYASEAPADFPLIALWFAILVVSGGTNVIARVLQAAKRR